MEVFIKIIKAVGIGFGVFISSVFLSAIITDDNSDLGVILTFVFIAVWIVGIVIYNKKKKRYDDPPVEMGPPDPALDVLPASWSNKTTQANIVTNVPINVGNRGGLVALKCPSCGADVSLDNSKDFGFCQFCGTKVMHDKVIIEHRGSININHSDNSTYNNAPPPPPPPPVVIKNNSGKGCLIAVAVLLVIGIAFGSAFNSVFTDTPSEDGSKSSSEVAESYTTVYEDKKIKVSFIKFEDNQFINTINMYMLVENKTNTAITVSIGNVSINGMSTNFELNGATNISPKESSKYPYTIALGSTDVEKSSDIKTIKFKINAYNSDTFDDIVKTSLIQMTFEE